MSADVTKFQVGISIPMCFSNLTLVHALLFLPARRYASAGLCDSDVSVCLSVCPDIRHTPILCLAERKQDSEMYTV